MFELPDAPCPKHIEDRHHDCLISIVYLDGERALTRIVPPDEWLTPPDDAGVAEHEFALRALYEHRAHEAVIATYDGEDGRLYAAEQLRWVNPGAN